MKASSSPNDIEEKILQLTFQLTRTKSPETLKDLGKKYNELLVFCSEDAEKLNILYRIMLAYGFHGRLFFSVSPIFLQRLGK